MDSGFPDLVEQHAAALTRRLADAYQVRWPTEPIPVELSCESGPNEAYTTAGPPGTAGHTVIAGAKLADGDAWLEIVFHEACHTVDEQIIAMVN